jgi:hypothetical protein
MTFGQVLVSNSVIVPNGVRCIYSTMVQHRAFKNFICVDRGFNSRPRRPGPGPDRPGMEAVSRPPGPYIMKAHGHFWIQPPGTGLHHLQSRPGSFGIEPTVTELIFVKARCLTIVL